MPSILNVAKDKKANNTNIWIQGFIGESWWDESTNAIDFVKEISAIETENITVFINSTGGSVTDGIAITNALIAHPANITTINAACAMSIASIILQAGDKRLSFPNAITMVHDCSSYAGGNSGALRETADILDQFNKLLAVTYAERGVEQAQIDNMLDGKDHFYSAEDALTHKLIDEVVDLNSFSAASGQHDLTPDYINREKTIMTDKNKETQENKITLKDKIAAIFTPKAEVTETPEAEQSSSEEQVAELTEAMQIMATQMVEDKQQTADQITALTKSNTALATQVTELVAALKEEDTPLRPKAIGDDSTQQADC